MKIFSRILAVQLNQFPQTCSPFPFFLFKIRRKLLRMFCRLVCCRFRGIQKCHQMLGGQFLFAPSHSPLLLSQIQWSVLLLFRLILITSGIIAGFALYHRTTNLWTLKNLGDTFMVKSIGRRPIVLGAFRRLKEEQNVAGHFAMIQFMGDGRQSHTLFCLSENSKGKKMLSRAQIERIHKGKRAANDVCSWGGHLAECAIAEENLREIRLTTDGNLLTNPSLEGSIPIQLEEPLRLNGGKKKLPLVVCIAPMYTYTDWQIMVMGIEAWMALGADKIIVPIQSASSDTVFILREYERIGIVDIRKWPKLPLLSDVNPNGLVLSRGIEESHVNCLHFVKPFAEMAVFTDLDDMLLPLDPMEVKGGINLQILRDIFGEHPNAGSLLFEHRDVQFVLPATPPQNTLANFNFDFLQQTQWKTKCKIWRMKTRVVVNASRVDSVNMHETGIHRFGFAQIRVPCRSAHFYHLRHSYKNMAVNEWPIEMTKLQGMLNERWQRRLEREFSAEARHKFLVPSSVESFADFDKCVMAINEEHWSLRVSRCLTPHVCYSRLARNVSCVATKAEYEFGYSGGDFVIGLKKEAELVESEPNCEAPLPVFSQGNHFYLP